MIATADMLSALDLIHYRMIDTLAEWMNKERINLDGFISNPQGHVNYNPYMIVDMVALQGRATLLQQIEDNLIVISQYKQGNTNITRTQHDVAFQSIPSIIYVRLQEWMKKRAGQMDELLTATNQGQKLAPISEYGSLITFDATKFTAEYKVYSDSVQGLQILIQYLVENGK